MWNALMALDGEGKNRPSNFAQTRGVRPRHGTQKMPVAKAPSPASLEEFDPVDKIDEEELTGEALKAEVVRRDRVQAAWLPRPNAQKEEDGDRDKHEVLDG